MKIFADAELKEEVTTLLDLGIVEAGSTREFTFWLSNDSLAVIQDLEINIDHSEARILEAPRDLAPRGVAPFTIEYAPSVTLKQGLKTQILFKARELWG